MQKLKLYLRGRRPPITRKVHLGADFRNARRLRISAYQNGEPFSGLKLASLKRRWLDRWKSSPGSKINTKRVILSPGSSAKVATEHQHLHRIAT
ncbi:hypothetical protein TNCV_1638751 [Trichonephila clavipes]|nr:hypothetical protein TNCV_1638751 [Trichonephila clavipes]